MRREAQTDVHRGTSEEDEEQQPSSFAQSGSGSDRDDDHHHGGGAGLLRRSVLFTADGGDVVAGPGPALSATKSDGQVPRDGRTD
ncbi:hypothetical protein NEMBOFW57_002466 [Staphylotrichum longicolle]|uniref:Uncharacterized protein n=1 Tax=Staphylotrichum longicolle TaxID=669026 RepID=A0AAD4F3J5_9PEZI|nr:hypothetical protein NEMBOFW57_002466 [Staphylotrichum longicolle]